MLVKSRSHNKEQLFIHSPQLPPTDRFALPPPWQTKRFPNHTRRASLLESPITFTSDESDSELEADQSLGEFLIGQAGATGGVKTCWNEDDGSESDFFSKNLSTSKAGVEKLARRLASSTTDNGALRTISVSLKSVDDPAPSSATTIGDISVVSHTVQKAAASPRELTYDHLTEFLNHLRLVRYMMTKQNHHIDFIEHLGTLKTMPQARMQSVSTETSPDVDLPSLDTTVSDVTPDCVLLHFKPPAAHSIMNQLKNQATTSISGPLGNRSTLEKKSISENRIFSEKIKLQLMGFTFAIMPQQNKVVIYNSHFNIQTTVNRFAIQVTNALRKESRGTGAQPGEMRYDRSSQSLIVHYAARNTSTPAGVATAKRDTVQRMRKVHGNS